MNGIMKFFSNKIFTHIKKMQTNFQSNLLGEKSFQYFMRTEINSINRLLFPDENNKKNTFISSQQLIVIR
jgi:hypothetical protein